MISATIPPLLVPKGIPKQSHDWLFLTPKNQYDKLPKNCRECGTNLIQESCVVYLSSGGYCEKCYCYWYEYENKRYTEDQALCRSLGMFPHELYGGEIRFKMASPKKMKKWGKIWHNHPSDWGPLEKAMLNPDQILLDGVNFP